MVAVAFVLGFCLGVLLMMFLGWLATEWEWKKRKALEYDVQKLMRHFACGQGYVGCNGGPNCNWSHK